MSLQTQGFQLSSLPRAPDVPSDIGKVDVPGIYDATVKALSTYEAMRTAPLRQQATDAQMALATQKAQAEQSVLPLTTAATAAQAQAEVGTPQTPGIFASKAKEAAAAAISGVTAATTGQTQLDVSQQYLKIAKTEYPQFQADHMAALAEPDPLKKAEMLEKLPVQYPWLSRTHADLAKDIETDAANYRVTAQQASKQKSEEAIANRSALAREYAADQMATSRENVAGTNADSRETIAAGNNATRLTAAQIAAKSREDKILQVQDRLQSNLYARHNAQEGEDTSDLDMLIDEDVAWLKNQSTPRGKQSYNLVALAGAVPNAPGTTPPTASAGHPAPFASLDDAQKAFNAGQLHVGDKMIINGQVGTWK